jgi:integrase/recombinase XerD
MTDTTTIDVLCQRMIEDMTARKLGPASQKSGLRAYKRFAAWLQRSPDTATADDIRLFQLHLAETGVGTVTRNATMTGLRFPVPRDTPAARSRVRDLPHQGAAESPADPRSGRGQAHAGDGPHAEEPSAAEPRLWRGIACRRDRPAQGQAYRQRADDHPSSCCHRRRSPSCASGWKVRPRFYDGGVPVQERLFFPGRKPGQPLTTRQLNRLFHETTHAAGIRKAVNLHSLRHYAESRIMPSDWSMTAIDRQFHSDLLGIILRLRSPAHQRRECRPAIDACVTSRRQSSRSVTGYLLSSRCSWQVNLCVATARRVRCLRMGWTGSCTRFPPMSEAMQTPARHTACPLLR